MPKWKPHSLKQNKIITSTKKFCIGGTGIQWGKTESGVIWLKTMMHKFTDVEDNFLVCSPSFRILAQSTMPPFMLYNSKIGKMNREFMYFQIYNGGKVWFRTGTDCNSVVGIRKVRAVLCDEAGLYPRLFWDNIQARAAPKEAPIRIVTSPYSLNWLFHDFIRPYKRGDKNVIEETDLVQATSKENPYFPAKEYERRKRTMDPRRFGMIFGGNFDKPEGLVYKSFDLENDVVEPFKLPAGTKIKAGIDWGYTDPFVIAVRAITPEGMHYRIGEFYKSQQTLPMMIKAARNLSTMLGGIETFYADPSRPDSIAAFCQAGLTTIAAKNDIRSGIDLHDDLLRSGYYKIFRGTCPYTIDEYETYHYPDPKDLKPDQDGKDMLPVDQQNHAMDAERYCTISTYKRHGQRRNRIITQSERSNTTKPLAYYDTEINRLKKKPRNNREVYL